MSQDYVQQSANIISDALDVGADSHYSGTSPVQAGDQFASLASLQANGSQERFSPALQLLSLQSHGGTGAQYSLGAVTNTSQGSAARHGAGGPSLYKQQQSQTSEKQLCTFFLRTGTCAYADRCKFRHPLDRLPPQLNSRGYPLRATEPDCAHYLKKGWCAFSSTCKFNHPELSGMPMLVPQTMAGQGSIGAGGMFTGISNLGSFPVSMLQPAAAPIAANSAAGMYPAVQGMYYMPAAPNAGSILPGQVSGMGGTGGRGMQHGNAMYANSVGMGADIMNAAAMGGLGGAYSTPMMRQPQSHGIMQSGTLQTMQAQYGLMQGGMQGQAGDGSGSMGMGMQGGLQSVDPYGSLPASLTRAMQSMRLGGNGQGRK